MSTYITNVFVTYNTLFPDRKIALKMRQSITLPSTGYLPGEELKHGRSAREISGKRPIHSIFEVDGLKPKVRKRCTVRYEKKTSLNEGSKVAKNETRKDFYIVF